jgi:hypothetical protein
MTIKLRLDSFFFYDIQIGVRNSVLPTVHITKLALIIIANGNPPLRRYANNNYIHVSTLNVGTIFMIIEMIIL